MHPLRVPHEVPPVQERAYTRPSSTHAIWCARWHPELAVGGQGRGEDFTPSGRPPIGGWRRHRTTILDLDASTRDQMVTVRSIDRALGRVTCRASRRRRFFSPARAVLARRLGGAGVQLVLVDREIGRVSFIEDAPLVRVLSKHWIPLSLDADCALSVYGFLRYR